MTIEFLFSLPPFPTGKEPKYGGISSLWLPIQAAGIVRGSLHGIAETCRLGGLPS
jgi:hypothetical protein